MNNKILVYCIYISILTIQLSYGQDWPNLNRYKLDNLKQTNLSVKEDRIVFMGNSITEGWIRIHPSFFENKPYINRGISGQTTSQMLLRFRQDVINLNPSVVVILAGINDIAENTGPISLEDISANIFTMAELAKFHNIKVVLCTVLPASYFSWRTNISPGPKVIKLNNILQSYANKNNIPFVDYYSSMVNNSLGLKQEFGDDGVHPNKKGYIIMENLLEKTINNIINEK